jgi:hypothetical protein
MKKKNDFYVPSLEDYKDVVDLMGNKDFVDNLFKKKDKDKKEQIKGEKNERNG